MKLISMTDYVIEQAILDNTSNFFANKVMQYANFLKQPLNLGMFVPTDEDGNVLEIIPFNEHKKGSIFHAQQHWKFDQAKERFLFEGFVFIGETDENWLFKLNVIYPKSVAKNNNRRFNKI